MEKKTLTYGDLKCRKAELQDEMEKGYFVQNIKEYRWILKAIREVETWLLWSIFCLIMFVAVGCHTVDGIGGDLKAWSSPYIQTQEK